MNCRECQDSFEVLLSGQTTENVRKELQAHLAQCSQCAKAFAEEEKFWVLLGKSPVKEASLGFAERVLRQLDVKTQPASRWWFVRSHTLRWGAAFASILVAVGIAVGMYQRYHAEHESQARVDHFKHLFEVVQNTDADVLLSAPLPEGDEAL